MMSNERRKVRVQQWHKSIVTTTSTIGVLDPIVVVMVWDISNNNEEYDSSLSYYYSSGIVPM